MTSALTRLVGEAGPFLDEVFGKVPLHVPASAPDAFDDVLGLGHVDDIVATSGLRAPSFRLVKDGATLPRSAVTRRVRIGSRPVDDLVDVAAVHAAFADGASVVLQGLHRSWPPVAELCRALEAELTHPVQANAYLTPPVAQGLHLHADPHDVFAVQTHGVKRWVVHPPGEDEPWDLELKPGDVLYLPAGTRHAAQTVELPSLHLTIGVRTTRWSHLVRRAFDGVLADADADLDATVPAGWANDPDAYRETLASHLEAVAAALRGADPDRPLAAAAQDFFADRVPDRSGGLRDLLALDALDDATEVRRRPHLGARLQRDGDHVELVLPDRRLRLPASVEPALAWILAADRFRVADLDDHLDEASRLVLCRRLVREGLLTLYRGGDRA
ncbi:MAG TPA: cupin domain-containing protein [Egicoccus sp.]|nr:cupin domain-containing protein [Egicoccus sp.]HSK23324.1 cupin domain-containing protein [Egicoccus sp.]